jgi:hypothetical protein
VSKEEEDKAKQDADFDERTKKHGKVIEKVSIINGSNNLIEH